MRTLLVCVMLLAAHFVFAQTMSINVLDATVKGMPIEGATVYFEKGERQINAGKTDAHGRLLLPNGIFGGIDDASVKIIISKPGYATLSLNGPFNGLTFALSKTIDKLDSYRVVLTWDKDPLDLDSHLTYPGNHIFFDNKVGSQTNLDVDDTDSYGPETITINKTVSSNKYIYAVHDFSNQGEEFSRKLSDSRAKVVVYIGNTQIETFYVPQGKIGNLWVLFTIDEFDDLKVINEFTTTNSVDQTNELLSSILADGSVLGKRIASDALKLNRKGEQAYHSGDLEGSIRYYKQAIEVKNDYSQAYSNLGLSYQKQGKFAEAIWANRRAIAIASGSTANTVKASSFYNIARIFEEKGEWSDALENFKWALKHKEHDAYKTGIARMNQKLGVN